MKRFAIVVLALLASGCRSEAERKASFDDDLGVMMRRSSVWCVDGNMVRVVGRSIATDSGLVSGWTILDAEGKPKRCPERHDPAPVELKPSDPYVVY